MPYETVYVPAEIALEHKGVTVYHTYKNDDVNQPRRDYGFSVEEDSHEDEAFDVRDFKAYINGLDPIENLKLAIDAGELAVDGPKES